MLGCERGFLASQLLAGAGYRIRTSDPLLVRQMLYR